MIVSFKKKYPIKIEKKILVSLRAATRGIYFHKICENYLYNKNISEYKKRILSYGLFNLAKSEIDRIDNIYGMEKTLYSHSLKLAGRTDLIAEFNGELAVIDYKTSRKIKTWEMCHSYFMQGAFYAHAYEEQTGIPVNDIVIIMAVEAKNFSYVRYLSQSVINLVKLK